jgi:predicted nucleotidyltransferase
MDHLVEHYRASSYFPLMSKRELIAQNRDAILALAAKHGATNVRVFGSVARGDDDETSDIDVLVNMEPGRSLLDMGGLLMDLRDLLGCTVDVISEHKDMRPHFREEVLRDAVSV